MKIYTHFFLPFVAFFLFINQTDAQDSWTKKANFPGVGRTFTPAFSIGNCGYVGGGDTSSDGRLIKNTNDFWQYNPDSNTWTQKANIPGGLKFSPIYFKIGNKGYIGSGDAGNDFWEFDPSKNSWTRRADFPGNTRVGSVSFAIGGKGYTGMGVNLGTGVVYSDFWEYDTTTNRWSQKSDFSGNPRYYAIGFSIGNKGFIGTGLDQSPTFYNDFWQYDPVKDKWAQKANIGYHGRYGCVGFSMVNMGYIGFGYIDSVGIENGMWAFDTTTSQWTQMSYCDTGYVSLSPFAFSIGNKAYVGTGVTYYRGLVNDFYQYTNHTSGINESKQQADFEIYPNPSTGNFIINSPFSIESYQVCDMRGKEIYRDIVHAEGNSINVNLSLPNGIYLVRVISNRGTSVKKVLVTGN